MNYDRKILIIPDSNYLYVNFSRKTDFREFTFSSNFNELIQTIEKNELQEKCVIGLSEVVLEELLIQRIEAYNEQIEKLKQLTVNYIFPHLSFDIDKYDTFNYVEYITKIRTDYLRNMKSKLIEYIDLPIPNQIRFTSIIRRAFEKRPPFEGSKGKSDKGFKDALLWESILDIELNSDFSNVIICTSDERMRNSELTIEFNQINPNIKIEMVTLPILTEILKSLITDKLDLIDSSISINEITQYLTDNTAWMMDIKIDEFYSSEEYSEYSIVNFEVIEYDVFDKDIYKVRVNLKYELIDINGNRIINSRNADLFLKYSDGELFFIEFTLEGTQL